MKRIFLDTDVVMDFLTKRQPFAVEAMKLMEYSNRKELELNISSLSSKGTRKNKRNLKISRYTFST